MSLGAPVSTTRILFSFALALIANHTMADTVSSAKTNDSPKSQQRIVIHGASYAKGWTPSVLGGLTVVNTGVGGDESQRILERLKVDVIPLKPRAVVVWGFINDIARSQGDIGATRDRAYQNVVAMLDQLAQARITPVLATEVTITTRRGFLESLAAMVARLRGKESYQAYVNKQVRAVNDRLRTLAATRGITLLDFEKVLSDEDGFRRREFAVDDGSHLTEAAYVALTAYADPILTRQFAAGSGTKAPPAR